MTRLPGPELLGSAAPDFTLKDQNNQPVTLSALAADGPVLVVFFPLAFSGICTGELDQLRDSLPSYDEASVRVLAVSVDSVYTLKVFSQQRAYGFPILSDFWPHGAVAQRYGVFDDGSGIANRGTFLVDDSGIVRFAEVNEPGQPRDQTVWARAVAELPASRGA